MPHEAEALQPPEFHHYHHSNISDVVTIADVSWRERDGGAAGGDAHGGAGRRGADLQGPDQGPAAHHRPLHQLEPASQL